MRNENVMFMRGPGGPELIIVGGTGGMPPEPPQKTTLKVKIPFASIEAKPICLRNPEALFSTLHFIYYIAFITIQS